MKLHEIYDEMILISKNIGITIRKDKGNFKSGHCFVNDQEMFILNKNTPVEMLAAIVASGLSRHSDKLYIKPVIRDFIEKEAYNNRDKDFNLEVNF
jgi:hypothetical protein